MKPVTSIPSTAVSLLVWIVTSNNPVRVNGSVLFQPPAQLLKEKLMIHELPDTGEEWTTLKNGVEFQPAGNLSPLSEYHLRKLTSSSGSNNKNSGDDQGEYGGAFEKMFVDGTETRYDEYAQAWRALGFFVDCDYVGNNNDEQNDNDDNQKNTGGCQRFMLWAAVSAAAGATILVLGTTRQYIFAQ